MLRPRVKELTQTHCGYPSQWSGKLESGEDILIHFRFGLLTVLVAGKTERVKGLGEASGGILDTPTMRLLTQTNIDWSLVAPVAESEVTQCSSS